MMKKVTLLIYLLALVMAPDCFSQTKQTTLWSIGKPDGSVSDIALAPNGFRDFVGHDFGYEDKFFLIGHAKEKDDFPYVIPGPVDTWGGTWPTAGWRTNEVNILFGVERLPFPASYKLVLKVLDYAKNFVPLIKVSINGNDQNIQPGEKKYDRSKQPHPRLNEPVVDSASLTGDFSSATPETIEIPIPKTSSKEEETKSALLLSRVHG